MWEQQVGERICQLRKGMGMSRSQFGHLIGASEQYVGRIERGMHNITGYLIASICNLTNASADYIIFGTIDPILVVAALQGLSNEQISICLDLLYRLTKLINTENGNNLLVQEVLKQEHTG